MLSRLRDAVTPLKQRMAAPIANRGISPHVVSLMGIPLALLAALCTARGWPIAAFCAALPAVLMDFLDGEVARLQNRTSHWGNFLEAIIDRVVDAVLLIGMSTMYPVAASAALAGSFLVSYVKARVGLVIVSDNRDWPGLGDRSDRVVLLLLAILLQSQTLLWVLTALTIVGSLQRVRYGQKLIQEGNLLPYLRD